MKIEVCVIDSDNVLHSSLINVSAFNYRGSTGDLFYFVGHDLEMKTMSNVFSVNYPAIKLECDL